MFQKIILQDDQFCEIDARHLMHMLCTPLCADAKMHYKDVRHTQKEKRKKKVNSCKIEGNM